MIIMIHITRSNQSRLSSQKVIEKNLRRSFKHVKSTLSCHQINGSTACLKGASVRGVLFIYSILNFYQG